MFLIILFSFVNLINCQQLFFEDCGGSGAYFRHKAFTISPYPIKYPGSVNVSIDIEVLKEIPSENFEFRVSVDKLNPYKMHIPCINSLGSCSHDYCEFYEKNLKSNDLFTAFAQVPCPIKPGKYSYNTPNRSMPKLGDIFEKVVEGKFDANGTYLNSKTGQVYACIHVGFDVELHQ